MMSRSSSQSRWKSSSFRNTDGRKKNDEEMMMKILSLGGDDEETTTATNEGGKQRREDRHQHLCLQHWHLEVIQIRWWLWWWWYPSAIWERWRWSLCCYWALSDLSSEVLCDFMPVPHPLDDFMPATENQEWHKNIFSPKDILQNK